MSTQLSSNREMLRSTTSKHRKDLLENLLVHEHQFDLAGISTAVLVGGEGQPLILLHGPGESSLWWMRVIPLLVQTHRVIVPDMPGHGASKVDDDNLDTDLVFPWLSELIKHTCSSPPVLVGNIIGGSIGARFAVKYGQQIDRLVLVDSLGLGKFRPAPRFAFGLFRFMVWPTEKNFDRFFPQCMYDVDELRNQMGNLWEPFLAYNLECARDKERSAALKILMKELGIPRIPPKQLEKIEVPTFLIWGRHDKANKLAIAEAASKRYGWPLHVIEETRDDPKLERPETFTDTLYDILNS